MHLEVGPETRDVFSIVRLNTRLKKLKYIQMDDSASVRSARTPTRSELNTFKVLSNLDFTDLNKREPVNWTVPQEMPKLVEIEERHESPPRTPVRTPQRTPLPMTPEKSPRVSPRGTPTRDSPGDMRDNIRDDMRRESRRDSPLDVNRDEHRDEPRDDQADDSKWAKASEDVKVDVNIEKEALLYELELMEKQGLIKLHRQLTMDNSLEEIQYQYDRSNMIVSTQQTVDWAKTSIKMGSGIVEGLLKRFGIGIVDGFSNNLCKDMSKFNKPLTKMYRKYWRRGTSSPEMELAMIVFGALAMTVMGNKGLMGSAPKEPLSRPVPPPAAPAPSAASEPSALRPPSVSGFGPKPVAMPEWAKAALEKPAPQHFAQAPVPQAPTPQNEFPEVRIERLPVVPVEATKKLTLAPARSPKSSRRAKPAAAELNLDI